MDQPGDLLALIGYLGGPAVIVGHSISGGAAAWACGCATSTWPARYGVTPKDSLSDSAGRCGHMSGRGPADVPHRQLRFWRILALAATPARCSARTGTVPTALEP